MCNTPGLTRRSPVTLKELNNTMPVRCPACGSDRHLRLYPDYSGRCVTSQMFFLEDIVLDNRCCQNCGFIFNAQGVRGIEEEVYSSKTWIPKPDLVAHDKNKLSAHQNYLDIFLSLAEVPEKGAILDCGAGTGAFLQAFRTARPQWELAGIEPGGGFARLADRLPLAEAYNQPYYDVKLERKFDLVASLAVLEHVADPLGALKWMRQRLSPNGKLLLQLPNFAKLPGDLFCADHINKMTVPHTRLLAEHAGFELLAVDDSAVMFYLVLGKTELPAKEFSGCPDINLALAGECEAVARQTVECVKACVESATKKGGMAAVFGTSPIGSMAPLVLNCRDKVACLVDENTNTWGRKIDGRLVVGPDKMKELGVTDLALAISPLYWENVARKMEPHGVSVHVPNLG